MKNLDLTKKKVPLTCFLYAKELGSRTTTMYYVRVNTSELDCGDETMDVEVSSDIYNTVETDAYHEFTVVTDTLFTGKKRGRVYY